MAEPHTPLAPGEEEAACKRGVDISPAQDGGVRKEILREGTGEEGPCSGDTVYVHYVGTLLTGDKFDSSRDRGDQFSFTLGKGQVIKGWDVGVASMKRGELCNLICRSEYAYGINGSPPKIPPNATLCFEVELFDWKGEDLSEEKDGSITRSIVEAGQGFDTPNDGATVDVHITGVCSGGVFEDRDVSFPIGEGCEHGVIPGIETALLKFKKNEKSKLKIASKHAYGLQGDTEKAVPPSTDLTYEVTLRSFEKGKESWELSQDEKIEQSELFKTKGTDFFKAGKFKMAVRYYKKVATYLEEEIADDVVFDDPGKKQKVKDLALAAQLNMAMCFLKLGDNMEAKEACVKAVALKADSDKAFFRFGTAEANMKNYDSAIKQFQRVLDIDPANKAAKNQISVMQQKIKADKAREKKLYANMFAKMAENDAKEENGEEQTNGHSKEETEASA